MALCSIWIKNEEGYTSYMEEFHIRPSNTLIWINLTHMLPYTKFNVVNGGFNFSYDEYISVGVHVCLNKRVWA